MKQPRIFKRKHPLWEMNEKDTGKVPDQKLGCAVIVRAIRDLFVETADGVISARVIRREANNWIHSPRATEASFIWWCRAIGFCPNTLRIAIKRIQDKPELLADMDSELARGLARMKKWHSQTHSEEIAA